MTDEKYLEAAEAATNLLHRRDQRIEKLERALWLILDIIAHSRERHPAVTTSLIADIARETLAGKP